VPGVYGMHGRFQARPGQGEALTAILLEAAESMRANDACLLYVVSREDADAIWVTEAWTDREAHAASLDVPGAKEQIARAMPLIAGIDQRVEFEPLGGKGL
jgi:quinol monooxygenase YgiN